MKLVFYSGGQSRGNQRLHQAVVDLARGSGSKRKLRMTYLPFCSDSASVFFGRAVRRYRAYGVDDFVCLSADQKPSLAQIKDAMKSDIIYLAGGNTFYFLKHLRDSGVLSALGDFASRGGARGAGVIAGLSAGGLILTPTIKLAGQAGLHPDDNEVGLRDLRGLGLVDFEFSPHYDAYPREVKIHTRLAKQGRKIFCVHDGAGIIVQGDQIQPVGRAELYVQGERLVFNGKS